MGAGVDPQALHDRAAVQLFGGNNSLPFIVFWPGVAACSNAKKQDQFWRINMLTIALKFAVLRRRPGGAVWRHFVRWAAVVFHPFGVRPPLLSFILAVRDPAVYLAVDLPV